MKGDMSIFIFIIVAVVLAGGILVIGMGGITQVGSGLDEFLGMGQRIQSEFAPKDIKTICNTWVSSGANQYNPETIFNLRVAEAFQPYPQFNRACGLPLQVLVTACKSGSEDCENGVLDKYAIVWTSETGRVVGNDIVSCCTEACGKAIQLFDSCELTANTEAEKANCFNIAMEDVTRPC